MPTLNASASAAGATGDARPRRRLPFTVAAVHPATLESIVSLWEAGAPRAFVDTDSEARPAKSFTIADGVARVRLGGPLVGRAGPCDFLTGAQTYGGFRDALRAAAEGRPDVIVIDVDSPGGEVTGVNEAAEQLFDMRGRVPTVAYVSGQACSAAYWIASAADRIVVSPTATIGSVGVYGTLVDETAADERAGVSRTLVRSSQSPRKAPDPQSDEAMAQAQSIVDGLAEVFVAAVARHRGVTPGEVLERYGQGAEMHARDALAAGLIDGVAGPDDIWLVRGGPPPVTYRKKASVPISGRPINTPAASRIGGRAMANATQTPAAPAAADAPPPDTDQRAEGADEEEATMAALKEENEMLRARIAELESERENGADKQARAEVRQLTDRLAATEKRAEASEKAAADERLARELDGYEAGGLYVRGDQDEGRAFMESFARSNRPLFDRHIARLTAHPEVPTDEGIGHQRPVPTKADGGSDEDRRIRQHCVDNDLDQKRDYAKARKALRANNKEVRP